MNRLYALLGRILDIPPGSITDATSPDTVDHWDSYNALMIVSELEETFGVHFTMDEVIAVKNVGDIKAALTRHGVKLGAEHVWSPQH